MRNGRSFLRLKLYHLSAVLNNVWIRRYDVNARKTRRRPFENNLKET